MLFQYPFVFEIERGQTDVVPVALLTAGALLFTRKKYAISGVMMGVATAYKLYPMFPCIVVTIGLFLVWLKRPRRGTANWLSFGASAVGGFVGVNLLFLSDAKLYFFKVLPGVSVTYIPAAHLGPRAFLLEPCRCAVYQFFLGHLRRVLGSVGVGRGAGDIAWRCSAGVGGRPGDKYVFFGVLLRL